MFLGQSDSCSPSDQNTLDFESDKISNEAKQKSNDNLTDLRRCNFDSESLQDRNNSSYGSFDDESFLEKHRLKDPNLCKWIEAKEPQFRKKLCAGLDIEIQRKLSLEPNIKEGDISLENLWYDLEFAPEIHIDSSAGPHLPEKTDIVENENDSSISSLPENVKKHYQTRKSRPTQPKGLCEKYVTFGHIKINPKGCHTRYCNLWHPKLCKNSMNFKECPYRKCKFQHLKGTKFVPQKNFENTRFTERNEETEKYDFIMRNLDKFISIYNISSQIC